MMNPLWMSGWGSPCQGKVSDTGALCGEEVEGEGEGVEGVRGLGYVSGDSRWQHEGDADRREGSDGS